MKAYLLASAARPALIQADAFFDAIGFMIEKAIARQVVEKRLAEKAGKLAELVKQAEAND